MSFEHAKIPKQRPKSLGSCLRRNDEVWEFLLMIDIDSTSQAMLRTVEALVTASMVSRSNTPLRMTEPDDAPTNCLNPDCVTTLFAMPNLIWAKSAFMCKTDFTHKSTVSPNTLHLTF